MSIININTFQWVTLAKFCELTGSDLTLVKENIKQKQDLFKFTARLTPRSQIMINYKMWLFSLNAHLRAA